MKKSLCEDCQHIQRNGEPCTGYIEKVYKCPSYRKVDENDTVLVTILVDGNFVCCYNDAEDGGKGKFVIYDEDGVQVKPPTEFEEGWGDKMEIIEVYRENCEKCESENTRSFIEYNGTTVTIICKDCGHRKVKK